MASSTQHSPVALRSIGQSTAQHLLGEQSRSTRARRSSNEALRAPGASSSSLLASAPPCKSKGADRNRPAEAPLNRARSSRNAGRNHLGTPSEIKSEWWATSSRIRGRLPPESAKERLELPGERAPAP